MKKGLSSWHFLILVFLLPFLAYGTMRWYENKYEKLPVLGIEKIKDGKKMDHTVGNFELVNQDGQKVNGESFKGKIAVVDFFFTHCPSICPKMTASLQNVQTAYDDKILLNSFSVDPEHDSVSQLKKYAKKFGINTKNWNLLTGDKKEIYKLARNGFMITAADGDGGTRFYS